LEFAHFHPTTGKSSSSDNEFVLLYSTPGGAEMVTKATQGFNNGISGQPISDGMAGAYLLKDTAKNSLAVFKPGDEEVGCASNPKVRMQIVVGLMNELPDIHFPSTNTFFQGYFCGGICLCFI
jgi:hypothetical protein